MEGDEVSSLKYMLHQFMLLLQRVYVRHGIAPNVRRDFLCEESGRRLCHVQLPDERVRLPDGTGPTCVKSKSWFPRPRARAGLGTR